MELVSTQHNSLPDEARVYTTHSSRVLRSPYTPHSAHFIQISYAEPNQVSLSATVLHTVSPFLSVVEILHFYEGSEWQNGNQIGKTISKIRYLELLRLFIAVKNLPARDIHVKCRAHPRRVPAGNILLFRRQ